MIEVVKLICDDCKAQFGPVGMHGFDHKNKNGELPGVCKKCKNIFVCDVEKMKILNNCSACQSKLEIFNGSCPKCDSKNTKWVPDF